MKFKANNIRTQIIDNSILEIVFTTKEKVNIDDLKQIIENGKEISVEAKQFRVKRSLDSNAYMWILISKMAAVLNTSKDELYLQILQRYGIFTHIIVKENVVERVRAEWKTVIELGEVTINGAIGVQLQCYFGSHTYDSKEMSVLINGVVEECKELGIETISSNELERMKSAWGR